MAIISDKIMLIIDKNDGYIYGLSERGNLYKIDPLVTKTWILVQYAPVIEEGSDKDANKKG